MQTNAEIAMPRSTHSCMENQSTDPKKIRHVSRSQSGQRRRRRRRRTRANVFPILSSTKSCGWGKSSIWGATAYSDF